VSPFDQDDRLLGIELDDAVVGDAGVDIAWWASGETSAARIAGELTERARRDMDASAARFGALFEAARIENAERRRVLLERRTLTRAARREPRARKSVRGFQTTYGLRKAMKVRRARNADNGRCVNENSAGTHGPATHGCRCASCDVVHKRSA